MLHIQIDGCDSKLNDGVLAMASHELKSPLTTLGMGVHLLLNERIGSLSQKQHDLLESMRDEANRMRQIIENLLEIERLREAGAPTEFTPIAAKALVGAAVDPMREAFRERGIELLVDVPASVPCALVDEATIHHLFSNLLGNALKYTPAGGQVHISAEPRSGGIWFLIQDTGPGIPEHYIARVFERWFRVPGQSRESGTGLGLALARDIVRAHGGEITLESPPGEGVRVQFTLRSEPCEWR